MLVSSSQAAAHRRVSLAGGATVLVNAGGAGGKGGGGAKGKGAAEKGAGGGLHPLQALVLLSKQQIALKMKARRAGELEPQWRKRRREEQVRERSC
jgi:hypothetical protein